MRRRATLALAAMAAWLVGAGLGTAPTAGRAVAAPIFAIQKAHPAESVPSLTGSKPIFIVLIGSGAREGENYTRSLADAIHLLGINPAKHRATILDFPRDSWVNIPGHGAGKINASMVDGGPPLVVKTVESITGIHIDYYAVTSFWGFQGMVDDIGGIYVDVPIPMHDRYSKTDFDSGFQKLNGHDALAFSRDRHSPASGDFARTYNQGQLLVAALTQFRKYFTKDPSIMLTWIGAGMRNVETDLSLQEVTDLAFTAFHISPKHVNNIGLPGSVGAAGGESIVKLSSANKKIYNDVKNDGIVRKKVNPPDM